MDEKKYTLTKEEICFHGRTLYRIKALKDFGDVKRETLVVGLRKRKIYLKKVIVGYMVKQWYVITHGYMKMLQYGRIQKFQDSLKYTVVQKFMEMHAYIIMHKFMEMLKYI